MAGTVKSRAGADEVPALRVHIVRKGDTLEALAKLYLGSAQRSGEIMDQNRLENGCIREDDELVIPDR